MCLCAQGLTLRDPVDCSPPGSSVHGIPFPPPEHLPHLWTVLIFLTLYEEGQWPMGPGFPAFSPFLATGSQDHCSSLPEPQGLLRRGRRAHALWLTLPLLSPRPQPQCGGCWEMSFPGFWGSRKQG